jgi:hypothetical protein
MERFVRQDRERAEWASQSFGRWYEDRTYVLTKFMTGHYRLSSPSESVDEHIARIRAEEDAGRRPDTDFARDQPYFSNIKKGSKYSGEMTSKWYADIRLPGGGLQRYAGIWDTMDDAIQEVIYILNGM